VHWAFICRSVIFRKFVMKSMCSLMSLLEKLSILVGHFAPSACICPSNAPSVFGSWYRLNSTVLGLQRLLYQRRILFSSASASRGCPREVFGGIRARRSILSFWNSSIGLFVVGIRMFAWRVSFLLICRCCLM